MNWGVWGKNLSVSEMATMMQVCHEVRAAGSIKNYSL